MRLYLIAVGTRMDAWVATAYAGYTRRLPPAYALHLVEIPMARRTRGADLQRCVATEGERMLAAAPAAARLIALDERGQQWDTPTLAEQLAGWHSDGRDVALLLGGPDGLAPACRKRAELTWSLSRLTFPHALARVIVAEQIFRAWSLLQGHPYHRA